MASSSVLQKWKKLIGRWALVMAGNAHSLNQFRECRRHKPIWDSKALLSQSVPSVAIQRKLQSCSLGQGQSCRKDIGPRRGAALQQLGSHVDLVPIVAVPIANWTQQIHVADLESAFIRKHEIGRFDVQVHQSTPVEDGEALQ
mmetsp:Transcript_54242/g.117989  ORF Transcript_54242/g.117989 Transcript_54242/m.117989 type:complete len:143 (-) Transcript_54242:820-1248(-)